MLLRTKRRRVSGLMGERERLVRNLRRDRVKDPTELSGRTTSLKIKILHACSLCGKQSFCCRRSLNCKHRSGPKDQWAPNQL